MLMPIDSVQSISEKRFRFLPLKWYQFLSELYFKSLDPKIFPRLLDLKPLTIPGEASLPESTFFDRAECLNLYREVSIMLHKTAQMRGSLNEKTHQFLMYNKDVRCSSKLQNISTLIKHKLSCSPVDYWKHYETYGVGFILVSVQSVLG